MASSARHLTRMLCLSRRHSVYHAQSKATPSFYNAARPFTTTLTRRAAEDEVPEKMPADSPTSLASAPSEASIKESTGKDPGAQNERTTAKVVDEIVQELGLSKEEALDLASAMLVRPSEEVDEINDALGAYQNDMAARSPRERREVFSASQLPSSSDLAEPRMTPGFFSDDEEADDPGEDDEFAQDDIATPAHAEIEQIRELREYARVQAWDMPLLHKYAKPFEPPSASKPLRFRYTTYMGETHPGARKVALEFKPSALPDLTPVQVSKLIKILGPRYNPLNQTAQMSCDQYPLAPQNKRSLGDTLDRLLEAARDPSDTFEDLPVDERHVRLKKGQRRRVPFPDAWKMSEERRAALTEKRELADKEAEFRQIQGAVVDGARALDGDVESNAEVEHAMAMGGFARRIR